MAKYKEFNAEAFMAEIEEDQEKYEKIPMTAEQEEEWEKYVQEVEKALEQGKNKRRL